MDCCEVRELLSAFNDGEAPPGDVRAIEEHLRACKECTFASTMVVGLSRLLGSWEGVRASEKFRASVLDRVRKEPPPAPPGFLTHPRLAIAGGVACLLVIAAGVWVGLWSEGETERAARPGADEAERTEAAARTEPRPVARVLGQEGTLRIARAGGAEALGSKGDQLSPGDTVSVSGRGRAEIAFVEGFRVLIEGGGEFVLGEAAGGTEALGELRSGRMLVRRAGAAAEDAICRLEAGNAVISLGGPGFAGALALSGNGEVRLLLASGRAEVETPSIRRSVEEGQSVTVAAGGERISRARPGAPEELRRLEGWAGR